MHDKCNEYFNLIPIHLTGDFAGARIAVKKAFDLDRKFRAKFVKDDSYQPCSVFDDVVLQHAVSLHDADPGGQDAGRVLRELARHP